MYERILLATDETRESLTALREGALLAKALGAKVFLLVVVDQGAGVLMAAGVHPVQHASGAQSLLDSGLDRLRRLGVSASGAAVVGEPALEIGAAATRFVADLVVVGHRRRPLWERWWSGKSGAYLVDHVACSVMVARNRVSDEEFEARLERVEPDLTPSH